MTLTLIHKIKKNNFNKNFLILIQSKFISNMGNVVYSVALQFWVLDITKSPSIMELIMGITLIPSLIFQPIGGVLSDKFDKKKLLIITDLIRGVSILAITVGIFMGFINIYFLIIVELINKIAACLFAPTSASLIPYIVKNSKLSNSQGVLSLITFIPSTLGMILGGYLFFKFGAKYLFLFNSLTFFVSAFLELFLDLSNLPLLTNSISNKCNIFLIKKELKEGLHFIFSIAQLKYCLIFSMISNLFFNLGLSLFVPYFNSLKKGSILYTSVLASISIGGIVSSLLFSKIKLLPKLRFKIFSISHVFLFIFLTICMISNSYLSIFAFFLIGSISTILNIISTTAEYNVIDKSIFGRVIALNSTLSMFLSFIAPFLAALLIHFLSIKIIIILSFIICGLIGVISLKIKNYKLFINFDIENDDLSLLNCSTKIKED